MYKKKPRLHFGESFTSSVIIPEWLHTCKYILFSLQAGNSNSFYFKSCSGSWKIMYFYCKTKCWHCTGTCMGASLAPEYACFVLWVFGRKVLSGGVRTQVWTLKQVTVQQGDLLILDICGRWALQAESPSGDVEVVDTGAVAHRDAGSAGCAGEHRIRQSLKRCAWLDGWSREHRKLAGWWTLKGEHESNYSHRLSLSVWQIVGDNPRLNWRWYQKPYRKPAIPGMWIVDLDRRRCLWGACGVGKLKQFTMVKMTVFPADRERPMTKSTAIWDQGRPGTGRGLRRPAGGAMRGLVPGTHHAGSHKFSHVFGLTRPPKVLAKKLQC